MKTKMKISLSILGSVIAFGSAANASVISVNMDAWNATKGFGANVSQMASSETAGIGALANWNAYDPTNGSFQGGTPVYDSGAVVLGGFTLTGGSSASSWNTGGTGNQQMFGDYANTGIKTITNIPYALYDIIVYAKRIGTDSRDYTIGGTTLAIANRVGTEAGTGERPQQFDSAPPTGSSGIFAVGTHYQTFTGLSGSSQTLTHGDGLTGFQIVQIVPEPSSMALLALGGLALLRRRRS